MKRTPPPIQARNTILARDIAGKLSAQGNGQVSVSTCLELVAAARGFGSYAAYTQAVKDKSEPADFKMAQCWLVDPKAVVPRIASLGLAESLNTPNLVIALQAVLDELMAKYPDRLLVVARSTSAFLEDSLETIVSDAINDALNPEPKTRADLDDRDQELRVAFGTLSVAKVGPLPEKVGGWLRASVHGDAERDDLRGIYVDPEDADEVSFIARIRLRRVGKQLYTGCKAEILALDDVIVDDVKPDIWSDPDELTAMIGTGAPDPADQQNAFKLLRELEQSRRVPTLQEINHIIDSFGDYSPKLLELVETYAAPIAVRLINMKSGLLPPQGVRILEALLDNGCQLSKLSLAHALHNGWGCREDNRRARFIVDELLSMVAAGEIDFIEKVSYAELYSLGAALAMQAGDREKAFALYERAAEMGHKPSALFLERETSNQDADERRAKKGE